MFDRQTGEVTVDNDVRVIGKKRVAELFQKSPFRSKSIQKNVKTIAARKQDKKSPHYY